MGDFLRRVNEKMPLAITAFGGGSKDNAIPRTCEATFVALGNNLEFINDIAAELQAEIRTNFAEPEAVVEAFNVDAMGGNALSVEDSKRLIDLVCAVPNSVQAMSQQIPGLVQTSLNLGISKLAEELKLTFSVRSSVNQEKQDLLTKLRAITEEFGGSYSQTGEYPAWEYKEDSLLRDTMVKVYADMYGKQAEVVAIHAGLECGLLGEKLPGLDAVSIGPEMHDIHTSRERLGIASVGRTWDFVLEILKAL
jgi:dipeptidase D